MAKTNKSTPVIADPESYSKFLEQIKADILQTQLRAALSITIDYVLLAYRQNIIYKSKEGGLGSEYLEPIGEGFENRIS